MNILKYYRKKDNLFVDYFIEKEKDFLKSINIEAYNDSKFKFYMGWFIYAINDYTQEQYDITEKFTYFFLNNFTLDIRFFVYIISEDFRNLVIKDIDIYKRKFRKENIYI